MSRSTRPPSAHEHRVTISRPTRSTPPSIPPGDRPGTRTSEDRPQPGGDGADGRPERRRSGTGLEPDVRRPDAHCRVSLSRPWPAFRSATWHAARSAASVGTTGMRDSRSSIASRSRHLAQPPVLTLGRSRPEPTERVQAQRIHRHLGLSRFARATETNLRE
jgi:hypothetical protein